MRRYAFILVFAVASTALADGYRGPARPTIPTDAGPIRTKLDECTADIKQVTAWDAAATKQAAQELCELRAKHATARKRLGDALAQLVDTFKDATNHDHAAKLPTTIGNVQAMVKQCVATLETQQYCHNVACKTEPEHNAMFCENQAADLVGRILGL